MKKNNKTKITFIGAGRVATALAMALHKKKFDISEVWSHHPANAKKLAGKTNSNAVAEIKKLNKGSDIYIIAVKDDFISTVIKKLNVKNATILHTSGTVSLNQIKTKENKSGVLYPLQTFTGKCKIDLAEVPFLIEGSDKPTEKMVTQIAKSISKNVVPVESKQRKKIHLSAVLVSNFPNYLYILADDFLKKEKIKFDILLPLIKKVTENLSTEAPVLNQTGPAKRKDKKTIQSHLEMLKSNKELKNIYSLLSDSIMKHNFGIKDKKKSGKK